MYNLFKLNDYLYRLFGLLSFPLYRRFSGHINNHPNPEIVRPCYHNEGPRICLSVSVRQMRHPCSSSDVCRSSTGLYVPRIGKYFKYVELCWQLELLNGGP